MTNYAMLELGQPMHAFDADTIEGHIIVRQANEGESLTALDGKTYTLQPSDIVIADTKKVLAIAGVMGGMDSGITENTTNICIESAVFDPISIRLTAQRLGLRSDASTRFEKSLDPLLSSKALRRAVQILDFAGVGGEICGISEYIREESVQKIELDVPHDFIESRIGTPVSPEEASRILTKLGFAPTLRQSTHHVTVPSHRATKDISIPEDIVEEIGRLHGYDTIPEAPIPGVFQMTEKNRGVALRNQIQNYFVGNGFFEAFNYSFSNASKDASVLLEETNSAVCIRNAVSEEFTMMRRSMAPLLLANVHENLKQVREVSFFEIARVHYKDATGAFYEKKRLAGILSNSAALPVRVLLDGFLATLGISADISQSSPLPYLHPNASGQYTSGQETIGHFGKIHPKVAKNFDLPDTVWYFEFDVEHIAMLSRQIRPYMEPNKFPSMSRELNFVMDERMSTGEIANRIAAVDGRIHSLCVQDVYQHEKIGAGKKSVTFGFVIEDRTQTITDEDALEVQNSVIQSLAQTGIQLRS
jgi:phenylalanyl-tRNA synthetase beta chain